MDYRILFEFQAIVVPVYILGLLIITFFLTLYCFKSIFKFISKYFTKLNLIYLIIIILLAFLIRFYVYAPNHGLVINELSHINAAKNFLETGRMELCNYNLELEKVCRLYSNPKGWATILSIFFFFSQVTSANSVFLAQLFGIIFVIAFYVYTFLIFKRKEIAFFSSFILLNFPLLNAWTNTAETNISSLFFIIACFCFLELYFIFGKKMLFLISNLLFYIAVSIRIEFYLFMLVIVYRIFLNKEKIINFKFSEKVFLLVFFIINLLISAANSIIFLKDYQNNGWYSYVYFVEHVPYEINRLMNQYYLTYLVLLLSIIGAVFLFIKGRKNFTVFFIWFSLLFSYYTFLYYQHQSRYIMHAVVGLIFFASYGLYMIINFSKKRGLFVKAAILCFILFFFINELNFMYKNKDNYLAHNYADYIVYNSIQEDIPSDYIIVNNMPLTITAISNKRAVNLRSFLDRGNFDNMTKYLFYWDFSCRKYGDDTYNNRFCEEIVNNFELEEYKIYATEYNTNIFYKIIKRKEQFQNE
ncbi:MAG: hypothetical protein V1859_03975 [archaeon]